MSPPPNLTNEISSPINVETLKKRCGTNTASSEKNEKETESRATVRSHFSSKLEIEQ